MSISQKEKNRLKSKYGDWALVTGASSGIGREIAMLLAEAGFNLVLVARRKQLLEELVNEIQEFGNTQTHIIATDLASQQGTDLVIESTKSLDIGLLVASAGFGTSGLFADSHVPDEVNMLEVNCKSLLVMTHHFSKQFKERGRGGIILMSSMVGFQGVPFAAHYAATKAYVQSLAEGLAVEFKPHNVDILAAAPGPVHSGFASRSNMQMDGAMKTSTVALPILQALGRKNTVLPGLLTKVLVGSLRTVPRWGKIRIMSKVMGGMTKHQRV